MFFCLFDFSQVHCNTNAFSRFMKVLLRVFDYHKQFMGLLIALEQLSWSLVDMVYRKELSPHALRILDHWANRIKASVWPLSDFLNFDCILSAPYPKLFAGYLRNFSQMFIHLIKTTCRNPIPRQPQIKVKVTVQDQGIVFHISCPLFIL